MVLKEYWPRCLQELIEFQQIANAEQPEFEKVVSDVKSAADDFFLVSLSEYGCERWEKILGLSVEPGDTLQDRRDRILIRVPGSASLHLQDPSEVPCPRSAKTSAVTLDENAYDLLCQNPPGRLCTARRPGGHTGTNDSGESGSSLCGPDIPQDDRTGPDGRLFRYGGTMNRHDYTPAERKEENTNGKIQVYRYRQRQSKR